MSYYEGTNWQAKKEDDGKPLFETTKYLEKKINDSMFMNGGNTDEEKKYYSLGVRFGYSLAAAVPSNDDYEGAGKILYPLELQEIIIDFHAWLESMITEVKKSIRPQIIEKIKSLEKYRFAAPDRINSQQKEIQRLKELIEQVFFRGVHSTGFRDEKSWQEFKTKNNL